MEGVDNTQIHSPPPQAMDASSPDNTELLTHVDNSDYVPSEAEREQISNRIREIEATRQRLEREIAMVNMDLDRRRAEEQEQRRKIGALKGSLSLIRRLPDELLNAIFSLCVFYAGTSPWVLAHVAQRFRRITLNARRIWSAVAIVAPKKNSPRYAYREFRHECTDVEILQHIIELSGRAPLDITIRHLNPEIAQILAKERDRWEVLEYYGLADQTCHPILFQPIGSSVLRKVVLAYLEWTPIPSVQWLETAKPLSLDIRNGGLSDLAGIRWWDRLEEFRIMAPWSSLVPTHGYASMIGPLAENQLQGEFVSILRKVCNRLKRLDMINISIPGDTPIHFPLLQELEFWNVGGWWLIECENLNRIRFGLCPIEAPTTVTYANVREFEIGWTRHGDMVTNLELPSLESFILNDPSADHLPSYYTRTWDKVKKMRLCLHGLTSLSLIVPFRSLNTLETLEIFNTPPSIQFFRKFEAGTKEPIVCPSLKRLLLDFSVLKSKVVKDSLLQVCEKIVSTREPNHPLESLRVQWPQKAGGGETEFVPHSRTMS
ncbi:hypothetical protein FRC16_004090 [Serendipita sp. 398]|nr:hypothetical protein FRC16_004090 [Serendipita sp. 398]